MRTWHMWVLFASGGDLTFEVKAKTLMYAIMKARVEHPELNWAAVVSLRIS